MSRVPPWPPAPRSPCGKDKWGHRHLGCSLPGCAREHWDGHVWPLNKGLKKRTASGGTSQARAKQGRRVAGQTWTYVRGHVGEQQLQRFVDKSEESVQHDSVYVSHVVQPYLR